MLSLLNHFLHFLHQILPSLEPGSVARNVDEDVEEQDALVPAENAESHDSLSDERQELATDTRRVFDDPIPPVEDDFDLDEMPESEESSSSAGMCRFLDFDDLGPGTFFGGTFLLHCSGKTNLKFVAMALK